MPAPEHVRLTFSGTIGPDAASSEIWSIGLALTGGTGGPELGGFITAEECRLAATALSPAWQNINAGTSGPLVHTRTRVALIAATGRTAVQATGQYVQGDFFSGAISSPVRVFPNQVALVHTLLSQRSGPTGKGRFFLPLPVAGPLEADGRMTDGVRDAFVTRGVSFLNEVNRLAGIQQMGRVCVASGGSVKRGIPAALNIVTSVGVGRVLDTVRSRRGALLEQREAANLAP